MQEKETLRQEVLTEITNLLKEGECMKVHVFKAKYAEPHHFDVYWNCYFDAIYMYQGNLLYDASGCYTSNLKEISSLDSLYEILKQMKDSTAIPINEEALKSIEYSRHCWDK